MYGVLIISSSECTHDACQVLTSSIHAGRSVESESVLTLHAFCEAIDDAQGAAIKASARCKTSKLLAISASTQLKVSAAMAT